MQANILYGSAAGLGKRGYNSRMIKIYALIDPENNTIKYIGQTTQQLYNRLATHVDKARRSKEKTPKATWIREVLSKGKRPLIKLLEEVDDKNKRQAEEKWIRKYGDTVLNVAPAGAGGKFFRKIDISHYLHLLGILSDGEIADSVGVSRKAISYHRNKLGIKASNNLQRMKPPPNMGGWNKKQLSEETISNLGKYPDYVLAKKTGVDKGVIARARRQRDIPAYAETTGKNGKFKKGGFPLRWMKKQ